MLNHFDFEKLWDAGNCVGTDKVDITTVCGERLPVCSGRSVETVNKHELLSALPPVDGAAGRHSNIIIINISGSGGGSVMWVCDGVLGWHQVLAVTHRERLPVIHTVNIQQPFTAAIN